MVIPVRDMSAAALHDTAEQSAQHCRSAEALERRRDKRKQKKYQAAAAKAVAALEEATYRPLRYEVYHVKRVHTDEHCQQVWGGEFAYPLGCGSFVDSFNEGSRKNDVGFVPRGTTVHIDDEPAGRKCTYTWGDKRRDVGCCHWLLLLAVVNHSSHSCC